MDETQANGNPEKKPDGKAEPVKALRTFESDIADALQKGGTSAAQIVIAEQAHPQAAPESELPENPSFLKKNWKMASLIAAIVIAGAAASYFLYLYFKPVPAPPPPRTSAGEAIIAVDLQKTIDLTGLSQTKIVSRIEAERDAATLRVNSTESLSFTENDADGNPQLLDTTTFLAKLSPSLSPTLLRSLDPGFAFGLLGYDGNQPFIILRTNSYQNAYDGMLNGEVEFYREAGDIFTGITTGAPSLATTTIAYFGTNESTGLFQDQVIQNTDARVVKNSKGNTVFMYAFPDQWTIVITTNEATYGELLTRLRRAGLLR